MNNLEYSTDSNSELDDMETHCRAFSNSNIWDDTGASKGGYNFPVNIRSPDNKKGLPEGAKCYKFSRDIGPSKKKRCAQFQKDGNIIRNKQQEYIKQKRENIRNKLEPKQPSILFDYQDNASESTKLFFNIYKQLKKDINNIILQQLQNLKYLKPNELKKYLDNKGKIKWRELYKRASDEYKKIKKVSVVSKTQTPPPPGKQLSKTQKPKKKSKKLKDIQFVKPLTPFTGVVGFGV